MFICKRVVLFAFVACLICVASVLADVGTTRQTITIDKIIDVLAAQEKQLLNLQVKGFMLTERIKSPQSGNSWNPSNFGMSGTAWLNGMPHSLMRIRAVTTNDWVNGAAPVAEMDEDTGYDGKAGRIARYRGGPRGASARDETAEIYVGEPPNLWIRGNMFATGCEFSAYFFRDEDNKSLAQVFRDWVASGAPVTVSLDPTFGPDVVKVFLENANKSFTAFWFDVDKGYALRRREEKSFYPTGALLTDDTWNVDKLKEAAPGIWYPVDATYNGRNTAVKDGKLELHFTADDIFANQPDFDPKVFTVPFPAGFRVTDFARNAQYVSDGSDAAAIEQRIDKAVQDVKNENMTAAPPGSYHTTIPSNADQNSSTKHLWLYIVSAAVVLTSIVALLMRQRNRGGRSTIAALCLLAVLGSQAKAEEYQVSCGVNVTSFVLDYYDRHLSIETIGNTLHAGWHFENQCSFHDIAQLLGAQNLAVDAYQVDTTNDLRGLISGDSLAILRLKKQIGDREIGHFVVMTRARNSKKYAFVDLPLSVRWFDNFDDLAAKPLAKFSGEVLIIKQAAVELKKRSHLAFSTDRLDLGQIDSSQATFDAEFDFHNDGTQDVVIDRVERSCGCIEEPVFTRTTAPGGKGSIHVRFDKKKLPLGKTERSLLVMSNDSETPAKQLFVTFEIPFNHKPDEIYAFPNGIQFGRTSLRDLLKNELNFTVVVPSSVIPDSNFEVIARTKSTLVTVGSKATLEDDSNIPESNVFQRTAKCALDWNIPPNYAGILNEIVTIDVMRSNTIIKTFVVAIQADVTAN